MIPKLAVVPALQTRRSDPVRASVAANQEPAVVSVICVNYNGGALLVDCVQSVLASSVSIELIISDNGSSDGSLNLLRAALKEDRRLKIVENGRNLGFAGASNAALVQAHGQYVLFLNPDCLIHPDTLQIMCDEMDARPNAAIAGCVIRNPDGSEQAGCRRRMPALWSGFGRAFGLDDFLKRFSAYDPVEMNSEPLPAHPIEVEAISGAFMFVRRSALEAVGPLDEGYFLHCEDLDWCMRFRQGGFKVFFVPSTDITHFKGVSSAARPVSVEWHKHRGMLRFYRKFLFDRYPRLVVLLVSSGVWLHFCFVAMRRSIRRLL
ncbi:MAG: glycosyltransferase family 2 protein [Rhodocyclaceae bacterium]|jgi:GT2 family glycosyltransferase|nr:N-acetylglucosaminyl-diphospho-decaprenol L-rhamnosyltransferase [Rhodocyclaceae bacterium]MCL4681880.1 glycosyltransferase family 2 protein [Rhodocyclaceae bacterium]